MAAYRSYVNNRALQPPQMARLMSKDLQRREAAFEDLLRDNELVPKLFSPGTLNDNEVAKLQRAPFYFYAYNDSILHFWNNNAVIVDSVIKHGISNQLL